MRACVRDVRLSDCDTITRLRAHQPVSLWLARSLARSRTLSLTSEKNHRKRLRAEIAHARARLNATVNGQRLCAIRTVWDTAQRMRGSGGGFGSAASVAGECGALSDAQKKCSSYAN